MNQVPGATGHDYRANYDKNQYKIVFTRVDLRANLDAQGKDLILNAARRTPVVEVRVNLAQNRVVGIDNPPAHIKYENVPVPFFDGT